MRFIPEAFEDGSSNAKRTRATGRAAPVGAGNRRSLRNAVGFTWLLAFTLSLLFAGSPKAQAQSQTVTLAADEWCPYNCAPGAAKPGYMLEIAERAFAKRGLKVNYVVMPWTKALLDAQAGKIDGVIGASRSELKNGVFPRVAQGRSETVLAMHADSPFVYTGPASLRGLRIAAAKDYAYDQGPIDAYFASKEAKDKVEFAWGEEVQSQNIRKLLTKRVDAWIENRAVAMMTIAEISPLPHLKLTPVGAAEPVFIAFSSAKADANLWAGLIAAETLHLRKSGELGQILIKYNLRDWE